MSCAVSLKMPGKILLYFIVAFAEDPVLTRLLWSTPSRRQSPFSRDSEVFMVKMVGPVFQFLLTLNKQHLDSKPCPVTRFMHKVLVMRKKKSYYF